MALSIAAIQVRVAEHFGLSAEELVSDRRRPARPRQVAYYLARELTPSSLPQIGRAFHRDHTTILFGIIAIERLIRGDPIFAADVGILKAELREAAGANRVTC